MMIKDRSSLLSEGNVEGRSNLLDILDYALEEIHPGKFLGWVINLDDQGLLEIEGTRYDLPSFGDIYVVGAGKGSARVVQELMKIIGHGSVKDGVVVDKRGQGHDVEGVEVLEADHPLPSRDGLIAGNKIAAICESAGENDLIFACITGGASALLSSPAGGISVEDVSKMTKLLLTSGAPIEDINAVRKHISILKGGLLAKITSPANLVGLIIVDEVGGKLWGPTVPDESTFEDAVEIIDKYELRGEVSKSILDHLERGIEKKISETPNSEEFKELNVQNVVLSEPEDVCMAARDRAEELGFNSMILSTMMEGESRDVGTALAGVARESSLEGRPVSPPCAIIVGGETTVTIEGESGEGGPNQELILSFSLKIEDDERIVGASIGTDGTDGPTEIAGGLVDGRTVRRAKDKGIDIFKNLMEHNSSFVLKELGDAIYTGPTGTNLMDLRVILVRE